MSLSDVKKTWLSVEYIVRNFLGIDKSKRDPLVTPNSPEFSSDYCFNNLEEKPGPWLY